MVFETEIDSVPPFHLWRLLCDESLGSHAGWALLQQGAASSVPRGDLPSWLDCWTSAVPSTQRPVHCHSASPSTAAHLQEVENVCIMAWWGMESHRCSQVSKLSKCAPRIYASLDLNFTSTEKNVNKCWALDKCRMLRYLGGSELASAISLKCIQNKR